MISQLSRNAPVYFLAGLVGFLATRSDAAFRDEVLADFPRVYYEFEEMSGTTADNSASALTIFNGTYVSAYEDTTAAAGGYTLGVTAQVGKGVELNPGFDAMADMAFGGLVDVPSLLLNDGSYTIEAVIKFKPFDEDGDVDSFQGLYLTDGYPTGGVGGGGAVHINVDRADNFHDFDGGFEDGGPLFWESENVFFGEEFWHLVFVVDTGALTGQYYVNGQLVDETFPLAEPFPSDIQAGTSAFGAASIGAWLNAIDDPLDPFYERFLNAVLDEFAVYSTALSEERVLAHFEATGLEERVIVPEPSSVALVAVGLLASIASAFRGVRRR